MANCTYTLYGKTFNNELELDEYLISMETFMGKVDSSDLVMSKSQTKNARNWTQPQRETFNRLWDNYNEARKIINKSKSGLKSSELYGPDYEPDYYIEGYVGISNAMEAYKNGNHFAFPLFQENEFWIREFNNLRNGKPSKVIEEYYFIKRGIPVQPINDITELNKIRKLFQGRVNTNEQVDIEHGIWPQKGILGIEIHEVLGAYFETMKKEGFMTIDKESDKISIRNKVIALLNTKRDKVKHLNDQLIINIVNKGFDISKAIVNKFGNDCDYLTEVSLIGQARFGKRIDLNNQEPLANHNVLGRLDMIIIDKDGNCHILDFKCSDNQYADYDDAKKRTFNYQLASYRKLLTTLGISDSNDVPSLHVIPIQMVNFETDNTGKCKFDDIKLESNILKEIDASSPLVNSNEFNLSETVLNNIFRFRKLTENEVTLKLKDTDEFMKKCFGEYGKKQKTPEELQEFIDNNCDWDVDNTRKKNQKYKLYINHNKHNWVQGETEAECIEKLKDLLTDRKERVANTTKSIIKKIKEAKQKDIPLVIPKNNGKLSDESTNEYLTKILSKYINPNWQVIDRYKGLSDMGIIMFKNIVTGQIDVKQISGQYNLKRKVKLGNQNTNLLGTFLSDQITRNMPNSKIMESTYGNIELMKVMQTISGIAQNFAGTNLHLGEIQIISESSQDSISADNNQLLWNYDRLCQQVKQKNNFSVNGSDGIKMLNYTSLLHNKITEILEGDSTHSRFWETTKEVVGEFKDYFDQEAEGFNKVDTVEKLIKLKNELESRFTDLRQGNINDIDPNDSPQNYVYIYLMGSLLECNNIDTLQQLNDHSKYVQNSISDILTKGINGSYSDNPGNQQSKILNQIYELCVRAYQNTRDDVYKFNTDLRTDTSKLKKAKGFNYLKRATYGLEASMYKNMYRRVEYSNGKYDLKFKNPFDNSENLDPAEREYLKKALFNICKLKNKDIKTMDDLENKLNSPSYDYLLYVPLTRGTTSSKIVSSGGILSCIKQKFNELNPKNIIEHLKQELYNVYSKDDEEKIRKKELWEMRTGFERGEVPSDGDTQSREYWIEQMGGINYFETNLELLQLKFKSAYSMKDNMNKVFPLIKALYTHLTYQGIISNDKFTNDLQYINDFITSKIFNRPLDDVEKFSLPMLAAQKAMAITSKLTLAFNPKQIYQHIDGFWKVCQLAFSKPTGATSSLGTEPFTLKHLLESWRFALGDLGHFGDSLSMCEGFNMTYGINDMDTNKLAEAMVSDKLGIGNFWQLGFRFASRPDFYNRLTIFLSQMKADKCFDAHSMKGNRLIYNFKKDGRFQHLINNQKGPEYDKELGLYIQMARQFELEGTLNDDGTQFRLDMSEINQGKIKDLPRAYTNKQAESIKALGDKIYGYYSHEKKSLMQSYTIGALLFQMHTYWSSKKNQYLSGQVFNQDGYYTEYEETTKNDNGQEEVHKWYYVLDQNGNEIPKRDDQLQPGEKAIPIYVWKGRPQEGILITLSRIAKPTFQPMRDENGNLKFDPIANFKKAYDEVLHNEDPDLARLYRANLRKLISDLLGWFFIGFLIAPALLKFTKDKEKETGNNDLKHAGINASSILAASMLKTSADDFNFASSILDVGFSSGPFSLGSAKRLYNNTIAWIGGDRDGYDTMVKSISGLNTMSPIMDYSKYVVLGRNIGDNGNEDEE